MANFPELLSYSSVAFEVHRLGSCRLLGSGRIQLGTHQYVLILTLSAPTQLPVCPIPLPAARKAWWVGSDTLCPGQVGIAMGQGAAAGQDRRKTPLLSAPEDGSLC